MEKKYYKIVRISKGKKLSYLKLPKDVEVVYEIRKWTYPLVEGSKLFVLTSLRDAENFLSMSGFPCAVYECDVKGPELRSTRLTTCVNFRRRLIRNFWSKEVIGPWACLERNTVVDAVRLTKRVRNLVV